MVAHAETAVGIGEELASKTKFIKLPNWIGYAIDAIQFMLEHPTQSAGAEATFQNCIASLGKRQIYYSASDVYELLELQLEFKPDDKEGKAVLERTGLGATTKVRYYTGENTSINLIWGSSYYTLKSTANSYSATDNTSGTTQFNVSMDAQTVNELPTYNSPYTSILSHTAYQVIGNISNTAHYAENTFYTNNPTYTSNHTIISRDTFNICNIVSPISSSTVINNTNINNYRQYGYDLDVNNNITFDPNVLLAYIQGTLAPQLELQYRNTYRDFPMPDATYGDDDIIYINPFDDEQEPTEDTSGQIQPFSIDYNEIISEREMESILAESRYTLDTTPYEIESIDYNQAVSEPYEILKQNKTLPAEIAGDVSAVYDIAVGIVPADVMAVYGFVAFLSVGMWFILRR